MRGLLRIILLFCLCVTCFIVPVLADGPNIEWQRCIGGTHDDAYTERMPRLLSTNDGGFLVKGTTGSVDGDFIGSPGYEYAPFIMKISSEGTIIWKAYLPGRPSIDFFEDSNGEILVCGGDTYAWVIKLDKDGNTIWSKNYDGYQMSVVDINIAPSGDGGYIIIAHHFWDNGFCSGSKAQFLKIDPSGEVQVNKEIDNSFSSKHYFTRTDDGEYLLVGDQRQVYGWCASLLNASLEKINSNGDVDWIRFYGGSNEEDPITPSTILKTSEGFIFTTKTYSNDHQVSGNHGNGDIWVVETDNQGNLMNQWCFGGSGIESPRALYKTSRGYKIIGYTNSVDGNLTGQRNDPWDDLWIFEIDQSGSILQQNSYNTSQFFDLQTGQNLGQIKVLPDEGFLIISSSSTNPTNKGDYDFILTRISPGGAILWQQGYGGSRTEYGAALCEMQDGGYLLLGVTLSNDGDVSGYHGGTGWDIWVAKVKEGATIHPLVTSVSPDRGYSYSGSDFEISISGTGFSPDAIVSLVKQDNSPVLPIEKTMTSPTTFECTFHLEGATPGYWGVSVRNPDGLQYVLPESYNYIVIEESDSKWETEIVSDSLMNSNVKECLKIDSNGNPHVLYFGSDLGNYLVYGWKNTTGWHTENITFTNFQINPISADLALDKTGSPFVVIGNSTSPENEILVLKRTLTGWESENIDIGINPSIVIDLDDTPHIIYEKGNDLMYAYFNGNSWVKEATGRGGSNGLNSISLAVDSSGNPHIVYAYGWSSWGSPVGAVKYIFKDVSGWHDTNTVYQSDPRGFGDLSITLTSDNSPRISFTDGWWGTRYPYYFIQKGKDWYQEKIWLKTGGIYCGPAYLSLNSENNPHLAFISFNLNTSTNSNEYQLMYDYFDGSKWKITRLDCSDEDPNPLNLLRSRLALDNSDKPHIIYAKGFKEGQNIKYKLIYASEVDPNSIIPTITTLNPPSITAGNDAFTLEVTGTNFASGAKVFWQGQEKVTTFVSSTKVNASITEDDVVAAGAKIIKVVNPDSKESDEVEFEVIPDVVGVWTQMTPNAGWSARGRHSSVVLADGSIVLMGGADGRGYKNDVWRSIDKGITWTQMTPNAGWSARGGHSSVAMFDGSIVLTGGDDGTGTLKSDVWQSTDKGATWTRQTANAEWSGRHGHSSVALTDGSIVLMGGATGLSQNDVWRSTDNGATWTELNASAGWRERWGQTSVVLSDDSIVLMGGTGGTGIVCDDVWRSTNKGSTWTQMTSSAEWSARYGHTSVALPDDSIWLMGGYWGSFMNDVWRSTDKGYTWTQMASNAEWTPRWFHSSVAMLDGSIVLIGGNTRVSANDVWRYVPAGSPSSLTAAFTASPMSGGPAPMTVTFFDLSEGEPTSWLWNFGNDSISTEQNPTHTYTSTGNYNVTLTVVKGDQQNTYEAEQCISVRDYDNGDHLKIEKSVTWALSQVGPGGPYANRPFKLVADAYNNTSGYRLDIGFDSVDQAQAYFSHIYRNTAPPRGSFVWSKDPLSPAAVALSLGDDQIIYADSTTVKTGHNDRSLPGYLGWSWPPVSSPLIVYPINNSIVSMTLSIEMQKSSWSNNTEIDHYRIIIQNASSEDTLKASDKFSALTVQETRKGPIPNEWCINIQQWFTSKNININPGWQKILCQAENKNNEIIGSTVESNVYGEADNLQTDYIKPKESLNKDSVIIYEDFGLTKGKEVKQIPLFWVVKRIKEESKIVDGHVVKRWYIDDTSEVLYDTNDIRTKGYVNPEEFEITENNNYKRVCYFKPPEDNYKFSPESKKMTPQDIFNLQYVLFCEGFLEYDLSGTYAGTKGTLTTAALNQFQQKYGLKQNGIIDQSTADKLNDLLKSNYLTYNKKYLQNYSEKSRTEIIKTIIEDTFSNLNNGNSDLPFTKLKDVKSDIFFGIFATETKNYDNTIIGTSAGSDWGRGIGQIDNPDSYVGSASKLAWYSTNGIDITKCRGNAGSCIHYYSNTIQGIKANLYDALYVYNDKYRFIDTLPPAEFEYPFKKSDYEIVRAIKRYNGIAYRWYGYNYDTDDTVQTCTNQYVQYNNGISRAMNCPSGCDVSSCECDQDSKDCLVSGTCGNPVDNYVYRIGKNLVSGTAETDFKLSNYDNNIPYDLFNLPYNDKLYFTNPLDDTYWSDSTRLSTLSKIYTIAQNPEKPMEYTFSYNTQFKVKAYEWDFGDDEKQSGAYSVVHTYKKEGTYNLKLKITFEDNKIKIVNSNLIVRNKISPVTISIKCPVDVEIVDPDGLVINKSTNLIGNATYLETDINNDGDSDVLITINEPKPGKYNLNIIPKPDAQPDDTYTVLINNGDELNNTTQVIADNVTISQIPELPYQLNLETPIIVVPSVDSLFSYTRINELNSFNFVDETTGNIIYRLWSFGDGTFAENVTEVIHTYSTPGNYTVTLTVSGPDGEDSSSQVIQVLPSLTPFPGYSQTPTDPDGDDLYEDLNGNGNKDFNDVLIFFKNMNWIATNQPVIYFDYNRNDNIDFNDVVRVFKDI